MKTTRTLLISSLILAGLQFGLSGCLVDPAVGVSAGVQYGPGRDPWFRDDRWVDGHRWKGDDRFRRDRGKNVDIYVHPPRIILPLPPVIRIR